ncbi:MAG: 5-formyltetrahydrofolate cyclo-ligase [Kiritimatiellae bacterium]|nr:5-formyltetrahydrofolate cyclo-ligase [Kiritimatiellia bacterium]
MDLARIQIAKDEIRGEMRARRRALSARERAAAASVVCSKLVSFADIGGRSVPPGGDATIAVYLASPHEIDLGAFIRRMLGCGVRLVAPRWNGECYDLAVLNGLGPSHLRRGPMGIMEPADGSAVPPRDVSLWIVPGLAFTRGGRRLGYGGGWYDRLLAAASEASVKLGVAYSFQIVEDLPAEPHDVPLAAVVDDSVPDAGIDSRRRSPSP